jgi:hypothetical protein
VPVFWINMDSALERAAAMRSQLARSLAPGVCATRVPAVTKREASSVLVGGLMLNRTAGWRFRGLPTVSGLRTGPLEVSITLSHLKAALTAVTLEPGAPFYLILEDDVELTASIAPRRPGSPSSPCLFEPVALKAWAAGLPSGWSAALLMIHFAREQTFRQLIARWRSVGSRPRALPASATFRAASDVAGSAVACDAVMTSAGAYLLSARGAKTWRAMWPSSVKTTGHGHSSRGGGLRVVVKRTCFAPRVTRPVCARENDPPQLDSQPPIPELVSDRCLLNHEVHGPLLSPLQARRALANATNAAALLAAAKSRSLAGSWRLFVATPPLVTDKPLGTRGAHGQRHLQHARARALTVEWWRNSTVEAEARPG